MNITKQEIEKVQENWSKFTGLVEKISNEELKNSLLSMCSELKDRLAVCPASTRTDYVGAYMGGLVETSLATAKLMNNLNKAYDLEDRVDLDSIIVCGLFSQLGKIGSEHAHLYLEKDSQWHNDRGIMFDYNAEIAGVPAPIRSIWWLTSSGVKLSEAEIYAITSLATLEHSTASSAEVYSSPLLGALLQHATRVVSITANSKKTNVLVD